MKDHLSVERLALLHPKAQPIFQKFIEDCETGLNIKIRISQGLRTFDEQDVLYAQGRTAPGKIVTDAKAGESYHNYGLAVDLVVLTGIGVDWKFDYKQLYTYSSKNQLTWGGFFAIKDYDHYEISFGKTVHELLAEHNTGNLLNGWVIV